MSKGDEEARITALERRVATLEAEIAALKGAVGRHTHPLWEGDDQGDYASEVTCGAPEKGWDDEAA